MWILAIGSASALIAIACPPASPVSRLSVDDRPCLVVCAPPASRFFIGVARLADALQAIAVSLNARFLRSLRIKKAFYHFRFAPMMMLFLGATFAL
ncbi:hypothetical protein [Myxosarcina sp. GI1(2024)]